MRKNVDATEHSLTLRKKSCKLKQVLLGRFFRILLSPTKTKLKGVEKFSKTKLTLKSCNGAKQCKTDH